MHLKLETNLHWLRKTPILLAFFCFLSAKDVHAYGLPPLISVPPLGLTVHNGDTASLSTTIGVSLTPLTVKWYLGDRELTSAQVSNVQVPLVGTTISTLTIPNIDVSQAGNYWVKVENNGGEAKSGYAVVVVLSTTVSNVLTTVNVLTSQCGMTNGGFRLQMVKPATSNCVIDASTDFKNWTPIHTNTSGSTNISFLDTAATNLSFRYYRARLQ